MIVAPKWPFTRRVMASPWIIAPLAACYTILVAPSFIGLLPALVNPQLDVLQQLFASAQGTTIAWIHIICFDLWVGRWVYLDSADSTIPPWLRRICLLCVLMAGPFGALCYLAVRYVHRINVA